MVSRSYLTVIAAASSVLSSLILPAETENIAILSMFAVCCLVLFSSSSVDTGEEPFAAYRPFIALSMWFLPIAPGIFSNAACWQTLCFDLASADSEERLVYNVGVAWMYAGLIAFGLLMIVNSPYGRHAAEGAGASPLWGFRVNGLFAWIIQELPAFLLPIYAVHTARREIPTSSKILLALFIVHYANRSFIFPMRAKGFKPAIFLVHVLALSFCTCNGWIQGRYLADYAPEIPITSPHFIVGVAIFGAGMAINFQADDILRNLRKPGETGYKIPYGGAFNFVSGANFFGEIVEWCGFALAGGHFGGFMFAYFTFCNTAPRAVSHHHWYLAKFKDAYPKGRWAVIPGVW